MNELSLSVGYSAGINDLEKLLESSNNISSVYTGGLSGKIAGGRPQYLTDLDTLRESVQTAHGKGVMYEIALNAPCGFKEKLDQAWWEDIKEYIIELENCGVDGIIVSHPFLIDLIKRHTKMKVIVSTICEIVTVRSALYYEGMGADAIVPSMNINYDLKALKLISNKLKHAKLIIMLNEHCLGDCPWRRFHHNHYAHSNQDRDYHNQCKFLFIKTPYLLLTNSCIRPEDVKNYLDITNCFKIVGRLVPMDDLIMRVKAYSQGFFTGNYVSLFDTNMSKHFDIPNSELNELFGQKSVCKDLCEECRYCIDISENYLKMKRKISPIPG